MPSPAAVVFDIGNVLLEWDPERYYDARLGRARRQALFDAVDLHAMNAAIDAGADFRATVYAAAERHPEFAPDIRLWHDDWLAMAGPEIPGAVATLHQLAARGVPVFALSNFGIGSFARAEGRYPFLAAFDRRYISGHLGVIKPDARIYAALEADSGVAPERLLFTDDRPENIAAAAERGWRTHRFDGPAGWAERLVTEGLLAADAAAPAGRG